MPAISSHFAFMDFPPEIRNVIYLLVLKYEVVLQRPPIGSTTGSLFPKHIGILMSSQQINQEASPIFYAVNAFQVNIYPGFATQPLHPRDLSHTRHLVIIDWCPRISTISIKKCFRTFKSTLLLMPHLECLKIYFETRPKHRDTRCAAVPVSIDKTRVAKTILLQYARIIEELPGPIPEGSSAVAFEANRSPQTGQFETVVQFPLSWINDL
jgi:hypothetical protein